MSSFDGAGLQDLRAMIADGDPGGLDAVASKWSAVHDALRQAQDDLLQHTLAATNHWQGAAADAFAARADELHQSLGSGAAFAFNASSGVSCAADALRTAQAAMPRETPRATASAIVRQATATDAAPAEFQEQQRQRAVAVMQRLEERYAAAGEMIGTPHRQSYGRDLGMFSPGPSGVIANHQAGASAHAGRPKGDQRSASNLKLPTASSDNAGISGATAPASPERKSGLVGEFAHNPPATLAGSHSSQLNLPDPSSDPIIRSNIYPASPTTQTLAKLEGNSEIPRLDASQSINETTPEQHQAIPPAQRPQRQVDASSTRHAWRQPATNRRPPGPILGENNLNPLEVVGGLHSIDHNRLADHTLNSSDPLSANSIFASPPSSPVANGSSRGRRRSARPRYLVEDELTWLQSSEANPPVIMD